MKCMRREGLKFVALLLLKNFLMWISSNEARAQITEFISIINEKWYQDVK